MTDIWAHSRGAAGTRQALRDHVLGTAALASRFAGEFGAADAGYAVGLLHDAGKVDPQWQRYLDLAELGHRGATVDHKNLGSALLLPCLGWLGALPILGHHGGIPDRKRPDPAAEALASVYLGSVPEAVDVLARGDLVPPAWRAAREPGVVEFGIRMLHSSLVDADYLDTAQHFAGATQPELRGDTDFKELSDSFERSRREFLSARPASVMDPWRELVYNSSVAAAALPPGVFRLPAPTGSGKTLASIGFALHHAAAHRKRRVVVAVPFTSITEQNAQVIRSLMGGDVVLEHHSAVEPRDLGDKDGATPRGHYAVENWDAPVVVTTTVQLFDSLFSNMPSKTRKLHRLSNAVIVLDEVQALPISLLTVILDGLRLLTQHFGATVLLASATQPTFEQVAPWREAGLTPHEVIEDPRALYQAMARVRYEWQPNITVDELVAQVAVEPQSLVIVNGIADAKRLADRLRDLGRPVLHLSTRMCGLHRRQVLDDVRRRLAAGEQVALVSTQLIEAGVDVDFPVVYRAMAPADSLLQAAGRANREGRRASGRVIVFDGEDFTHLSDYKTAVAHTRNAFLGTDLDDPVRLTDYYRNLYAGINVDLQAVATEIMGQRRDHQFTKVAEAFHMISNDSFGVVVPFGDSAVAVARVEGFLRRGQVPPVAAVRDLQRYTARIPNSLAGAAQHSTREVIPGVLEWLGRYDDLTGVDLDLEPRDTVI